MSLRGCQGYEVLIRWKDLHDYEATWEEFEVLNVQFPDFNLEDKVQNWTESDVISGNNSKRFGLVYG